MTRLVTDLTPDLGSALMADRENGSIMIMTTLSERHKISKSVESVFCILLLPASVAVQDLLYIQDAVLQAPTECSMKNIRIFRVLRDRAREMIL